MGLCCSAPLDCVLFYSWITCEQMAMFRLLQAKLVFLTGNPVTAAACLRIDNFHQWRDGVGEAFLPPYVSLRGLLGHKLPVIAHIGLKSCND